MSKKKSQALHLPAGEIRIPEPIEALARAIHEDYVLSRQHDSLGLDDPSLAPWDELPETLRRSNREQAADIAEKLSAISCEIVPNTDGRPAVTMFIPGEIEELAKAEHARWMAERTADGWTYGTNKDAVAKTSPYLVPWEKLTEEIRELDRDTVRRIPRMLGHLNLVAVRTAIPDV